jgi:hypothetical protein
VVAGGLLLIVSAFTPWVTTASRLIERGNESDVATYSGADLVGDCASTTGLVLCDVFNSAADVNPDITIFTGAWPILLGTALTVAGGMSLIMVMTHPHSYSWSLDRMQFANWILVVASVGLALATLLLSVSAQHQLGACTPRPACVEMRWGPTLALTASGVALIGISVVTVREIARRATQATRS